MSGEMLLYVSAIVIVNSSLLDISIKHLVQTYPDELCMAFYVHLIISMIVLLELNIYKHRNEIVLYLNELLRFSVVNRWNIRLRRIPYRNNAIAQRLHLHAILEDLTGALGMIVVIGLAIIGPFVGAIVGSGILRVLVATVIFFNIPPLLNVSGWPTIQNIILRITFFIGAFYSVLEVCANVAFGTLILLFATSTQVKHMSGIKYLLSSGKLSTSVRQYQKLQVIHGIGKDSFASVAAVFMGTGFYILMFSVTFSILGWKILSPLLYPLLPFVTAICLLMLTFVLPSTYLAYNQSVRVILEWKIHTKQFRFVNPLYIKKLVKSLQPMGFWCGDVSILDRDRATRYVYSIIDNCLTCILLCGSVMRSWNLI